MEGVVACVAYAEGRRVRDVEIPDISEVLKEPGVFVWVGLHDPSPELLQQIQKEFGLHDLAVEDAQLAHQRPKLEQYGDSVFVVLRPAILTSDQERIELGETHLFLGPRYIVSIRHGDTPAYAAVRTRCESTPALLAKGPGFVLYAVMDFIVDHYFPVLDTLGDQLERLEDEIFSETFDRKTVQRIYDLKRNLVEVKRAVSPLVDVCNRLVRFDMPLIHEDTRPYFRDVYDHAIRINEHVDTLRELLTGALEAHLSLTAVSQNDAMKKLAGWAAIIGVPTMVAGVYGMNFKFMPELEWRYGYPAVMAGLTVVCVYLYYRFKRSGWL
ncbi:MAG: magnesium/cobalt transporter CorA [Candidatus Rokubacteria bacterium]|nr:magnesium/cobalt transporter CorA [Candidatus Rokubacteria bacterium]